MNTIMPPASLLSAPTPGGVKKKRVLLIDTCQTKRELRAEVMRKFGMDVDCAADVDEARSWWRAEVIRLSNCGPPASLRNCVNGLVV
jgi:hypothetical protein